MTRLWHQLYKGVAHAVDWIHVWHPQAATPLYSQQHELLVQKPVVVVLHASCAPVCSQSGSGDTSSDCVLLQAIRSDNPIIFFEHVLLYNIKGETYDGDYCQSLEKAEVGQQLLGANLFEHCCTSCVLRRFTATSHTLVACTWYWQRV